MASKLTKQFRNKMQENKQMATTNMLLNDNRVVKVSVKGTTLTAIIERSNRVSYKDVIESMEDLFHFKRNFRSGEIIKLSQISDVMFDIKFIGTINNIARFVTC